MIQIISMKSPFEYKNKLYTSALLSDSHIIALAYNSEHPPHSHIWTFLKFPLPYRAIERNT